MKSLPFKRNKFSELFREGTLFLNVEEKADYNDKKKIVYNVTVLNLECNETFIVKCDEPLPKEVKKMDKIDFIETEVIFKGKGTSAYGTNIMAELVVDAKAKNCILIK